MAGGEGGSVSLTEDCVCWCNGAVFAPSRTDECSLSCSVEASLELMLEACERPTKRTYHYLNIGVVQPLACEYSNASENACSWPGFQPGQIKHLSHLVLAWAFILSSRWVEILTAAGEKASMNQSEDIKEGTFWKVVIGRQWRATMIRGGKTFYAPWCTGQHNEALKYVLHYAVTVLPGLHVRLV